MSNNTSNSNSDYEKVVHEVEELIIPFFDELEAFTLFMDTCNTYPQISDPLLDVLKKEYKYTKQLQLSDKFRDILILLNQSLYHVFGGMIGSRLNHLIANSTTELINNDEVYRIFNMYVIEFINIIKAYCEHNNVTLPLSIQAKFDLTYKLNSDDIYGIFKTDVSKPDLNVNDLKEIKLSDLAESVKTQMLSPPVFYDQAGLDLIKEIQCIEATLVETPTGLVYICNIFVPASRLFEPVEDDEEEDFFSLLNEDDEEEKSSDEDEDDF